MTPQQMRMALGAVGLVALIGAAVFAFRAFGAGNLYVVAPADQPLDVTIDDGQTTTIPAGQHRILPARQGQHTLTYNLGGQTTTSNLKMPNGWSNVLAAPKGYCFAEFDVTESQYSHDGHHLPKVIGTFSGEQSHVMSGSPAFSTTELPAAPPDRGRVTRVVPMPCEYVGHPDGDVLASTGMTKSG